MNKTHFLTLLLLALPFTTASAWDGERGFFRVCETDPWTADELEDKIENEDQSRVWQVTVGMSLRDFDPGGPEPLDDQWRKRWDSIFDAAKIEQSYDHHEDQKGWVEQARSIMSPTAILFLNSAQILALRESGYVSYILPFVDIYPLN